MMGRRVISRFSKCVACCAIAAYIAVMAAVFIVAPLFEEPKGTETFGDVTGRFPDRHTLHYQGQDYVFRSGEVENILVLGVDGKRSSGKTAQLKGQADFLLLLCIDRNNQCITPITVDRDTMASVQLFGIFGDPAGTDVMQICLAHAFSNGAVTGGENTLRAVSDLLGQLPIAHYMTLSIPGIVLLNDAVGGIEVTLEEDFSHLDPAMRKGSTVRLMGQQAEYYVRGRMDLDSGTNYFRAQRQMTYLPLLMQKLSAMAKEDTGAVETMLDTLKNHMESSLSRAEIIKTAHRVSDYEIAAPVALKGFKRLGEDRSIEFWLDWDEAAQLLIDTCYEKKE